VFGLTVFATAGFAQEEASKFDIFGEYAYLRFNPSLPGLNSRNFNGGGGGATYFFGDHFGIKGELLGYASTTWTETFNLPVVVTPHGTTGTIPAGTYSASGDMFTYQFGPVVRMPWHNASIFGETLFGGSNTNGYGNLSKAIDLGGGTLSVSGNQHPFSMSVGGGIDLNVSKRFSVRVAELDYFLTRYTNPITSTNNQNNFRYLAGFVYRFR
jgi:hypothetical protein